MAGFHGVDLTGHEHSIFILVYLTYFSGVVLSSFMPEFLEQKKGLRYVYNFWEEDFLCLHEIFKRNPWIRL